MFRVCFLSKVQDKEALTNFTIAYFNWKEEAEGSIYFEQRDFSLMESKCPES